MSSKFIARDRPGPGVPAASPETAYRLRRDAVRDPLTETYNRGFFEEALAAEFKRCRRRCTIIGLLLLDLDGFKQVNDRLGHALGDQLLQEVARVLRQNVREADVVARYGGDEFCVLVADTTEAGLHTLADRLLQAITNLRVERGDKVAAVGASVGAVTCYPRSTTHTCGQFLDAADKAMEAAKAGGKSRVKTVSLIGADDACFLRAVEECQFSYFLASRGRVTEEQFLRARPMSSALQSIGRLARRLGWMDRESLQEVLRAQRQSKDLFGVIALRRGFLTEQQVHGLLALQREPPEAMAEALTEQNVLTAAAAQGELQAYYRTVLGVDYRPCESAPTPVQG